MDENLKIIYRILRTLEKMMDDDEIKLLSAEQLGISRQRWARILTMMIDEGYIKGVRVSGDAAGNIYVDQPSPAITLKGIEYLEGNTFMQRAYKAAKGIADLVP